MRVSDFMGELVDLCPRKNGKTGTLRHKGDGYRGERRMKAKTAYRTAGKTEEASNLSSRLFSAYAERTLTARGV